MRIQELAEFVGQEGLLRQDNDDSGGFSPAVVVEDARERFGLVDVLIRPAKGEGEKWVRARAIQFTNKSFEKKQRERAAVTTKTKSG